MPNTLPFTQTHPAQRIRQILPGVTYDRAFVADPAQAELDVIEQCEFRHRASIAYGRTYAVPRLEAWYGSKPYHFNGANFPARPLPPVLHSLRIALECYLPGVTFDGCLVNLYRDGRDSVAWHSDDEPDMGDPVVASISLGATRAFRFRAIRPVSATASALVPNAASVDLEAGSLLVMDRGVQGLYQHTLPRTTRADRQGRRVNLTFRAPLGARK